MTTKPKEPEPKSEEFKRFEEMTRQIVSVPKREIDRRQAECERERVQKRKRPAKR
jgi:hypothetical protein